MLLKLLPSLTFSLIVLCLLSCSESKENLVMSEPPTALDSVQKQVPDWSKNATIYEVNLRQYSEAGTFAEFETHLPRLKQMGIKIIWLMPIHPIGMEKRKGTMGSYYSIKNYTAIDPRYGTMTDLKRLISKTHELGMYIILDWVANHSAWDNPWLKEKPDWYTKNDSGHIISPVADWSDVADLNYDNHQMREAMIQALEYWVRETGIDGYRCDMAGMVPLDFWRAARQRLDAIKPVFMLAEWEESSIHEAFDMSYTWKLHHLMKDVAHGKKSVNDIRLQLGEYQSTFPEDAYRVQFTSNHDENSWQGTVFERLGESAEAFAVFTTLIPGMPLIYSGQEAGLDKRLQFFEKDLIQWREHPFADLYKTLLKLKQNNSALWNGQFGGDFEMLENSSDEVLVFRRKKNEHQVLAILNLSAKQVMNPVDREADIWKQPWRPVIADKQDIGKPLNKWETKLLPWEYRVYQLTDKN